MLSEMWETYALLSRRLPEKETSASVQKRQLLLDKFLLKFLQESNTEGSAVLCEMKNVSNELSHEFMHNIFNITNSNSETEDNDITDLENYLLDGRGWMLLYAICRIGVQGVYNRSDLCNILLTLLPFCLKIRHAEAHSTCLQSLDVDPHVSISQCFHWVTNLPHHNRPTGYSFKGISDIRKDPSRSSRGEKKRYTKTLSSKEKPSAYESDPDDSDVKKTKQPRLRKSMRTQVWPSLIRDDESASEDDLGDSTDDIDFTGTSVSSSDLFQLILQLLEDLAVLDIDISGHVQSLSAVILPMLLDVLQNFATPSSSDDRHESATTGEDSVVVPWAREKSLRLYQQLVRVILSLSGIVATQQNGVRIILSLKVVTGLLSALAFCHVEEETCDGKEASQLEWNIIHDTVCGCLDLFRVVYTHLPFNPSFLRDANAVMELFRRHGGEKYFRQLYHVNDLSGAEKGHLGCEAHENPIKWLCNLIHCLKVVKVNYIHAIKCLKRRHRNCEYGACFHHHHDIFGAALDLVLPIIEESPQVQGKLSDPSLCQMAKWSCLLLECLKQSQSKSSRLLILCALREEGVCCCLQPASVVNVLVPMLPDLSPAVRNYALETLNSMLLDQFDGAVEDHTVSSAACSHCSSERPVIPLYIDSGFASSELGDFPEKQSLLRWRHLRLLRKHVLSVDESIAHSVAKHLITLAIRGNSSIKEELFFGVYLHVLNMKTAELPSSATREDREDLVSSSEENGWMSSIDDTVLLLCVSSLPYVLQVEKVMRLFLEKGGLLCLTQLLDNEQLRIPVMGVFEALIMIDEHTMMMKHAPSTAFSAKQSIEYRGGIVIQTFIDTLAQKTCAITASFQQLQLKGPLIKSQARGHQGHKEESKQAASPLQKKNKQQCIPETSEAASTVDNIHKCILETLPALQDMWKTCAKLCMNSETFRVCYRSSPCLYIVQETLLLALSILSDFTPAGVADLSGGGQGNGRKQQNGSRQLSSLTGHFSRLSFIEAVMIVCFSCQTILPLQQEDEEEEMWLRLRTTLEQCVELEPSKLRAVFDMLLSVAQPQLPSILEYSYAQITSMLSQQDVEEMDDEEDVNKFAHHWSDEEFEANYTEQGYEADTETNMLEDWHKEIEGSVVGPGARQSTVRCFPAVLRLYVELLVASQHTVSGQTVLVPVLLRLLHLLRSSHAVTTAACKQGLLQLLLKGFQDVFLQPSNQQQQLVLYEVLLTTIQVLGQMEISPSELGLLFTIFHQAKDMESMLSTLTGVVENSWVAPSSYLTFPAKANTVFSHRSQSLHSETQAAAGVWDASAIQCAVKDLQWPPFEKGFSLALWLSLDSLLSVHLPQPSSAATGPDQDSAVVMPALEDCVHLASLGDSTKMFEVWIHVASTALLVRLTSMKDSSVMLRETSVALALSHLDWHSIVFSYVDILDGSTSLGKLTVYVDGLLHHEAVLDHPASMWHCPVSKTTPTLHLGQSAPHKVWQRVGQYSVGPVLLFSDCHLSNEWWFHLYALGPTFGGLGKCDCGFPRVSYAGLLTRGLLNKSSLNQDVLAGTAPLPDSEKALMAQVLSFDPHHWQTYCTFSQLSEGGGASLLGLVPTASNSEMLLGQCPQTASSIVSGEMREMQHTNLPQALEQLGGVQALLFLVAKVFEQSQEPRAKEGNDIAKGSQTQSKAVHLLLTLLRRFPPLTVTFTHMQGHEMLAVVLRSSRSPVGYSLIKVLFDAATSESIFKVDGVSGKLLLRSYSETVICNVAVITHLLLCWQIWQRVDDSLMEFILSGLVVLVRKDHPHQAFNVRQLQAAGLVKLLFHMYLERIQEDVGTLSAACGRHVATIVASVMGQPPDLALLATVTDFLLQLHPPTTRFINYTTSAFYLHPMWLSEEDQVNIAVGSLHRKSGHSQGDSVKASPQLQQASNRVEVMERVQFHSQQDGSSEACLDSFDGSDISEDELRGVDAAADYPPLEAAPDTSSHSFCVGERLDNSNDWSGSSSDETSEDASNHYDLHSTLSGTQQSKTASESNRRDIRGMSVSVSDGVYQVTQRNVSANSQLAKTKERAEVNGKLEVEESALSDVSSDDTDSSCGEHKVRYDSVTADSWEAKEGEDSARVSSDDQRTSVEQRSSPHRASAGGQSSSPLPTQHASDSPENTANPDEGLETMCLCLLQYLWKVVIEQPQQSMDEVFCQVINPHALLVLAQSSSASIRIAVTQVITAYLWRAPVDMLEDFLRQDGLFLLANQLSAYPVCQSLVEAALSLMLQHTFAFNDHYMVGDMGQITELQQLAPVLVISMLCRTLPDIALCHNTLTVLARVIEKSRMMSKILIDLGLPDALCNLLFVAQCYHKSATDLDGVDNVQLLLLDVQNIFCLLAVTQFSWSGVAQYQQMEYLFTVLQAMEDKEKERGESGLKRAETARALQFAMVVRVLECVQQQGQDVNKTSGSLLTSPSSLSASATSLRAQSSNLLSAAAYQLTPSLPNITFSKAPGLRPVQSLPHMTSFLFNTDQSLFASGEGEDRTLEGTATARRHQGYGRTSSEEGKPSFLQRLFSRKKKLEYSSISQSELVDRFKKFLVLAVDLAVFQDRSEKVKPQTQHTLNFLAEPSTAGLDDRFLKHMFTLVYQAVASNLAKDQFHKRTRNMTMLSAKDVLRNQFFRLLTCMMCPKMEFDQRIFTISFLMGESHGRDAVRLLAAGQHWCTELGLHLHDLLSVWHDWLNPNQRDLLLTMLTLLRQCGCSIIPPDRPITPEQVEAQREHKRAVEVRHARDQQTWSARRATYKERVGGKFEELVQRVKGHAMVLTQQMAAQQGRERSNLVEHIKHTIAQQVQLKKNWQDMVHSLTHERGVWHHADSYPQSWELDPTEGPGRIRRRLMRCHLGLQSKYVRPSHQEKLACQERDPPLKYLFEDDHQVADSATLVYKLFTNDTVHNTFVCTALSPASESRGELLLGEQYVYFVADTAITDTDYTQMLLGNKDQLSMMWRYSELMDVHCRWYQLQDTALEMFLVTGRSHLLAFTSTGDRDQVVGLLQAQLDRPKGPDQTAAYAQRQWLEGSMTNFDYLTFLNKLAGRSFNDLMQYPVFPFVLRDYESDVLDLENSASFRDLRKPIAVQDKSRERKYIDNFEFLRQEMLKPGPEEVMRVEPFHYGSHYSNSGTVLHYLVRLPPFTRMFLSYQDRSFDIPDRTFHSIRTSWRLSSFDSSTDVKELIPEFFFLPEFFINSEGFDFGHRQNGEIVDDVLLPPWCKGDARLFVLIHRQALESVVTTSLLHHWLDLVFGYKQTGEEAVKAINVFHPSTYFGMDVSSVNDPVKRQALLTMIRTYGQTPKQLFVHPHSAADASQIAAIPAGQQHEKRTYVPRPVATVNGLRWGRYVGSPDMPQPVWQTVTQLPVAIASLVPLVTGPVFGIEAHSTLITLHTKPTGTSYKQTDVLWAGAITWEHPDSILRVVSNSTKPLVNFMPPNPYDKVTCCAAALDRCLLFVAGSSGNISVFNMTHNVAKPSTLHVWGLRRILCGHQDAVSVLRVCKAFGVVVSGSQDTTAIIWDLNRLSYVRTVARHKTAVVDVAISSTLGDVASVSHNKRGSELQVSTINGSPVGSHSCESFITCLAYSTAPEGRAINVIAGGLSTGIVRLWSSWDVTHLRDLSDDPAITRPILSVAYTTNSQALFVSLSDGTIIMWHNDPHTSSSNAALFMPVLQNTRHR